MFKNYVSVIVFTEAFKAKLPEDPFGFIRYLPTEFLLLRLSRINAILFHQPNIRLQTEQVLKEGLFADTPELLPRINSLSEKAHLHNRGLFSGPVISAMMKTCLENFVDPDPESLFKPLQVNWDIFKTILIYNELYYADMGGTSLESFEGLFKIDVMQQGHIHRGMYRKTIALLKFAFISKFIEENETLKEKGYTFCQYFGLGNPWLFGKFFLVILAESGLYDQAGKNILQTAGLPVKMIDFFSLDNEALRNKGRLSLSMDVIPKPFYRMPGGEVLILDYHFFQYAYEFGFFYSFYQTALKKDKKRFPDYNAFKGFIGLEYFEKYLVKKYLHAIFYRRNQKIVSTEIYQDFIVKASNKNVLIFEVKMIDIHPQTLEDRDFAGFKDAISKNFLARKDVHGKNKGVFQVIRQLENLSGGDNDLRERLEIKKTERINIYPVIIYNDPNLDITGVNAFVADQFEEHSEHLNSHFESVKPLVMMNVDTLVEFLALLKRRPQAMTDLIGSYHKYIKGHKNHYRQSKGAHRYRQCHISFSTYLNEKFKAAMLDETITATRESFDLDISDYGKPEQAGTGS